MQIKFCHIAAGAGARNLDTQRAGSMAQMAVTHAAMTRAGPSLAFANTLHPVKAHNSEYTKRTHAYAAQMEALRKQRTGGKQTVEVVAEFRASR